MHFKFLNFVGMKYFDGVWIRKLYICSALKAPLALVENLVKIMPHLVATSPPDEIACRKTSTTSSKFHHVRGQALVTKMTSKEQEPSSRFVARIRPARL